jgi:hypothetical protein
MLRQYRKTAHGNNVRPLYIQFTATESRGPVVNTPASYFGGSGSNLGAVTDYPD